MPTPEALQALEEVLQRLKNPRLVPSNGQVTIVEGKTTFVEAWKIIVERRFSQLPIYEGGVFKGLLLEDRLARWVANGVFFPEEWQTFDAPECDVNDAIRIGEKLVATDAHLFVPRTTAMQDVVSHFALDPANSDQTRIQAILVTHSGKAHERLLGIVTASDALDFLHHG